MRQFKWLVFLVLLITLTASQSFSSEEVDLDTLRPGLAVETRELYLDVIINGHPRKKIAEFQFDDDGELQSRAAELREIGIQIPHAIPEDEWLSLSELKDGSYRYDEAGQAVYINLSDEALQVQQFSLWQRSTPAELLPTGTGALLNYTVDGGVETSTTEGGMNFSGLSATLDSWLFHGRNSVHNSALVQALNDDEGTTVRRLDSFFSRTNPEKQTNLKVGDLISGGLAWTRPVRMAGVQFRRKFETRPDLIQQPLPEFRGTATVPSTVDIYSGNVKIASTHVQPGPYELTNIPTSTANGNLTVVVEGESGATREVDLPFGTSSALLRKGIFDFSVEAGVVRRGFGTDSDEYGNRPVVIASLRRGISDALTAEVHAETTQNLVNAGVGVSRSLGKFGVITAALAASKSDGKQGTLISGEYAYSNGRVSLGAKSSRKFGDYLDVADVTANPEFGLDFSQNVIGLDQIYASLLVPGSKWTTGLSYAHATLNNGDHRHSGTFTLGRQISKSAQFNLYAQTNLSAFEETSVFAGLSMQLGRDHNAFAGVTVTNEDVFATSTISKNGGNGVGDHGYAVTLRSNGERHLAFANGHRRFDKADVRGGLQIDQERASAFGQLQGSISFIDGNLYLSRRVNDSFVVVDVGHPDVAVQHENRNAGKTGNRGTLIIPDIISYEPSRISLDPNTLPLESAITETAIHVSVAEKAGSVVRFAGSQDQRTRVSASIRHGADYIPAGSVAVHLSSGEEYIIGYDGQLFFSSDQRSNRFQVETAEGPCEINLDLANEPSGLVDVGDVSCL